MAQFTLNRHHFWGINRSGFFGNIKVAKNNAIRRKEDASMAKKGGGGASPYVGNGNTPVKAPHIKGGGTESVKIITPKGK